MRPQDLIEKKRDGGELTRDEIAFLIRGYTRDEIPDYQMAAWLMAGFLRGLSDARDGQLDRRDAAFRRSAQSRHDLCPQS